jgi:DNA-binding response OmpR family regulator
VLRQLKEDTETAGIPVIMLTAKSQDADIFEGMRSGAALYLPKPFSPVQLLNAVKEALGG